MFICYIGSLPYLCPQAVSQLLSRQWLIWGQPSILWGTHGCHGDTLWGVWLLASSESHSIRISYHKCTHAVSHSLSIFLRIFWNAPASRCPSSSLCQSGVTRRPLPWRGWRPAASAGTRWWCLPSSTSTAAARSTSAKGQNLVGLFLVLVVLVSCSLHKSYQKCF